MQIVKIQVAITVLLVVATTNRVAAQIPETIRLPADPSSVVIRMEYSVLSTARSNCDRFPGNIDTYRPNVSVLVYADGRVLSQSPGQCIPVEKTISSDELQNLLLVIIYGQEFFQFTEAAAQAEIRAENARRKATSVMGHVSDCGDPVIRVATADQTHQATFNCPSVWIKEYPSAKRLGQFNEVVNWIGYIASDLRLWGPVAINQSITAANKELAAKYPDLPPVQERDRVRTIEIDATHFTSEFVIRRSNDIIAKVTVNNVVGEKSDVAIDRQNQRLIPTSNRN